MNSNIKKALSDLLFLINVIIKFFIVVFIVLTVVFYIWFMCHFSSDYNEKQLVNKQNYFSLYNQAPKKEIALLTYNFENPYGARECYVQIYQLVNGFDANNLQGFSEVSDKSNIKKGCIHKKYFGNYSKSRWLPYKFHWVGKHDDGKWDIFVYGNFEHAKLLKDGLLKPKQIYIKEEGHNEQTIILDTDNQLAMFVHGY